MKKLLLAPAPPRPPRRSSAVVRPRNASGAPAAPSGRSEPATPSAPSPPAATRSERRLEREQAILSEAEAQFARSGFDGTSLESIAAALGLSRHLLLYYFPSKEALYRRVIDEVMTQWLQGMGELAEGDEPAAALKRYIGAKLRSSAERPDGSRVFTQEVMAGAPRYADALVMQVLPALKTDVRTFERWARAGRVRALPFTHLMFVLWAATQAYADLAPQFALLLGKAALDEGDFAAAQEVIEALVLAGLGVPGAAASNRREVPVVQKERAVSGQPAAVRPGARPARAAGQAAKARAKRAPPGPKT